MGRQAGAAGSDAPESRALQTEREGILREAFAPERRAEHLDAGCWPAPELASLCAEALQAGIEVDYVLELIERRGLHPAGPHVARWPWSIRIYTLGRFSLVRKGEAMEFNGKSPRKPIELLQVLIALGGREVHTSTLMQALWPDAAGRDPRKSFDNTLHRLRHMLGRDDVLLMRDGKLTLSLRCCWVDAWAFERLSSRSADPGRTGEAIALYRGHFLEREADTPWLLPYRDRLRSRFQRLALTEGQRLEEGARWSEAARVYEDALELDNLAENFYRRLMFCHQQRGEYAEVQRVYRRCRELLSIVLGVKPSAETEAIRSACAGD